MTRTWQRWTEVPWQARDRDVLTVEPRHEGHAPTPPTVVARSMVHADGLNEYIVQLHNDALAASKALDAEELDPGSPWNNTSD